MSESVATKLIESLPAVEGSYRANANLAKTNWFNVGGPADVLFRPKDTSDLARFLAQRPKDIPLTILGVGSNVLVRDGGIAGVVIKLGRGFTATSHQGDVLTVGAGALSYNTSMYAATHGIGRLEFLSGIPGTIGGALAMNAGAYGSDTSSVLIHAKAVDDQGNIHLLTPGDIGYIYRGNTLPEAMIFVEASFQGSPDTPEHIHAQMNDIATKRQDSQPIKERTSGSTFKNPAQHKAWQLIDDAGCRGLTIGGAQVSPKHCNFFVNTGDATAYDIETLGETVRTRVKETSGVELEWEVQIIGRTL